MSTSAECNKEKSRSYQPRWERDFFVSNFNGETTCLICKHVFSVNKTYNIQRHYKANHSHFDALDDKQKYHRISLLRAAVSTADQDQGSNTMVSLFCKQSKRVRRIQAFFFRRSYELSLSGLSVLNYSINIYLYTPAVDRPKKQ